MDEEISRERCIVRFTGEARLELAGIDNATAQQWGEEQAERYLAFLEETLEWLAREPGAGSPLEEWPEYRVYLAKIRRRRSSHGHRIFYREIDGGIRVIRILHTAMNWPEHLI